ncbi:MAG: DNA repair protein RecN [Archangium sp.]|nr:DNA repair protein RecN [Archangium sp.]
MLNTLRLKNVAVVEEAEVTFGEGLTVLTGETGAGKSIVIDALGLLVGGRAEADVIRAGADEAVIEGLFDRSELLAARLSELGLPDDGPELSIRRSLSRQGKGRVHVNGALVGVGVLQRLMKGQVDIAGQHEHMALLDPREHLGLVDRFGAIRSADESAGGSEQSDVMAKYSAAWARVRETADRLQALGGDESQVAARIDYLSFQLEELERVNPQVGEDVTLEAERKRLASSEKLRKTVGSAEELTATQEGSAVELLGRAVHLVADAERIDPSLSSVRTALIAAQTELDDAARGLSRYLSGLNSDPRRLDEVDERLDALKRLSRKHAAPLEAVVAKRGTLAAELDELKHRAERRAEVEVEHRKARDEADAAAKELTVLRQKAGKRLTEAVVAGLQRLSMQRARFEVEFVAVELQSSGGDQVQFLFCANPGEALRPLAKVASGGEASRVMLAMKAAVAGSDSCSCSVFDEADAGIGGAVADVVGRLIKDIAGHRQVLCITHLPQVAAHADAHLRIEKAESKGRTRSVVVPLEPGDDRAHELARMLSGVEVTREALGAAEALLRSALRHVKPRRQRKKSDGEQRRSA